MDFSLKPLYYSSTSQIRKIQQEKCTRTMAAGMRKSAGVVTVKVGQQDQQVEQASTWN